MKNMLVSFCLTVVCFFGFIAVGVEKIYWQGDSLAADGRSMAKDQQMLFGLKSQVQNFWKETYTSPVDSNDRLQIARLSHLADEKLDSSAEYQKVVKHSNPFSLNYDLMIHQMILRREVAIMPE